MNDRRGKPSLSGHTVSIIVNLSSFSIVASNLFVSIQASILMPLQRILSKFLKPFCKYLVNLISSSIVIGMNSFVSILG